MSFFEDGLYHMYVGGTLGPAVYHMGRFPLLSLDQSFLLQGTDYIFCGPYPHIVYFTKPV